MNNILDVENKHIMLPDDMINKLIRKLQDVKNERIDNGTWSLKEPKLLSDDVISFLPDTGFVK
jgi:hypothetical protein